MFAIIPPNYQGPPSPSTVPKSVLSQQACNPDGNFGKYNGIVDSSVLEMANRICSENQRQITKGDQSTFVDRKESYNDAIYEIKIYWKDNCDSQETQMNITNPLADNSVTCAGLVYQDYKHCEYFDEIYA